MKKTNKLIGVLLVLIAVSGLFGQDLVEAIVAVVNDDIITLSEYKQEYTSRVRMLRAQLQGEELAKQEEILKENLLESLITDLLLLQEARKLGLNVTEQVRIDSLFYSSLFGSFQHRVSNVILVWHSIFRSKDKPTFFLLCFEFFNKIIRNRDMSLLFILRVKV